MSRLLEIQGQAFGRLIVLSKAPREPKKAGLWLCLCNCGTLKTLRGPDLVHGRVRSCGCLAHESKSRHGVAHPHWRGGRQKAANGYMRIYAPEHPRAKKSARSHKGSGWVLEHIVVMEQKIGRRLLPGENVHHKNGVRTDNRPENLELWTTQQPIGQRTEDLVEWAFDILRKYRPEALKEHSQMAGNRNTDGTFMYSPADDLASVPSPGAHSNPPAPNYFPDVSMTDRSGDSAPGSKAADAFGGMSETVSPGGAAGAVLAEGPTEPSADLGPELGGDLNMIPRPSGSY